MTNLSHSSPTAESLRQALAGVKDPASGRSLEAAGLIDSLQVKDGLVQVSLLTERAQAEAMETVRQEVERILSREPGVRNATAVLTAHRAAPAAAPAAGGAALVARGGNVHAGVDRLLGGGN